MSSSIAPVFLNLPIPDLLIVLIMRLITTVALASFAVLTVANERHQAWQEFQGQYQHDPQDADDPVPEITKEYGKHHGMHERDVGHDADAWEHAYGSHSGYTAFEDEEAEHYGTQGHPVHGEHHYARSEPVEHKSHSQKEHHDKTKKHHETKTGEHKHLSSMDGDVYDWEEPGAWMPGASHVGRAVKGAWDHFTGEEKKHDKHKASGTHEPAHFDFDEETGGRLRTRDAEAARRGKFEHKHTAEDDFYDAGEDNDVFAGMGKHRWARAAEAHKYEPPHRGSEVAPEDEAPDFDPSNEDHPDYFDYHKHLWARELGMDYDEEYDADEVAKEDFHGKAFEDRLHNKDHDAEGSQFGRRSTPEAFGSHADFQNDMA